MKVQQLRERLEKERESVTKKKGSVCMFSEHGPISVSMTEALVKTIEALEKRVAKLESK